MEHQEDRHETRWKREGCSQWGRTGDCTPGSPICAVVEVFRQALEDEQDAWSGREQCLGEAVRR